MATTDLLTHQEALAALNMASDPVGDDVDAMLSGISGQIDDLCGPVVARAVTEYHDGGCLSILPRTTPILSVTSVTEYDTAGTSTVLSAEDHDTKPADAYLAILDGHAAQILRRSSGSDATFASGRRNVALVVSAGRYADTEAVAGNWKRLAASVLRMQWRQEAPQWALTPDFDQEDPELARYISVEDMIRRRMPGAIKVGGIA